MESAEEKQLMNYIRSTFNYKIDVDAYNFQDRAKLQLLSYKTYKVYFHPLTAPGFKDKQDKYHEMTMKAFDVWSEALDGKIKFSKAKSEYESDIKVFFLAASRTKLGKQYQEMIPSGIFYLKGKLCIAIGIRNSNNEKIDYDKVYHVILHEIGHIMCLGHSSAANDVMSRVAEEYPTELSENDIFVLRLIYSLGSGVSYESKKQYINQSVKKFLKDKSSKHIPAESAPLIPENKKVKSQEDKNLLEELDSISDLKKYKMIIANLNVKNK
jgi:hypothetical protein